MKYDADIVSGREIPHFFDLTPLWMKKCKHFMKVTTTGTKPYAKRTSNAIVKASCLRNFEVPFNSEYGITGGEDTDLFYRLALSGAKFISCEESIVYDYVQLERSIIKWLFLDITELVIATLEELLNILKIQYHVFLSFF